MSAKSDVAIMLDTTVDGPSRLRPQRIAVHSPTRGAAGKAVATRAVGDPRLTLRPRPPRRHYEIAQVPAPLTSTASGNFGSIWQVNLTVFPALSMISSSVSAVPTRP
ncbi:hypothetical protein NONI108955_42370 [Nocardia ninae]